MYLFLVVFAKCWYSLAAPVTSQSPNSDIGQHNGKGASYERVSVYACYAEAVFSLRADCRFDAGRPENNICCQLRNLSIIPKKKQDHVYGRDPSAGMWPTRPPNHQNWKTLQTELGTAWYVHVPNIRYVHGRPYLYGPFWHGTVWAPSGMVHRHDIDPTFVSKPEQPKNDPPNLDFGSPRKSEPKCVRSAQAKALKQRVCTQSAHFVGIDRSRARSERIVW
jgi:hypothetical protein